MITEREIKALKYLINKSKNASDLTKKVCFLLLDESKFLTKEVCLVITPENGFSQKEAREISGGVHDMKSSRLSTYLDEIMTAMGTDYRFSHLVGSHNDAGNFDGENGSTIWIAKKYYEVSARRLNSQKEDVEKVILQSGLYGARRD